LPPAYDQGVFDEKVERTYQWIFEKYAGGQQADAAGGG
jgi:type I restriction enzyme R subunit